MLGENHSLINEFPEYREKITQLNQSNPTFTKNAQRYHSIDEEIRALELDNAPIGDDALHKLKQERAVLKDTLYRELMKV
ncbi:YdcH family protein [Marinomonas sp. 2405UD68-3]|uniref:YdcH family protein n=1 Tax=Marinomonas sp. 2405UD68-3 TaxID=3391835 RepID=UPI0039C9FA47